LPGKDSHPNEIAHRIAAEQIYLWLERIDLLPKEIVIREKYRKRTTSIPKKKLLIKEERDLLKAEAYDPINQKSLE